MNSLKKQRSYCPSEAKDAAGTAGGAGGLPSDERMATLRLEAKADLRTSAAAGGEGGGESWALMGLSQWRSADPVLQTREGALMVKQRQREARRAMLAHQQRQEQRQKQQQLHQLPQGKCQESQQPQQEQKHQEDVYM